MAKTKKIQRIRVYGGFTEDSNIFTMDHAEFVNYCGGLLAVNLFKGNFDSCVNAVLDYAHARGIKYGVENINKCRN